MEEILLITEQYVLLLKQFLPSLISVAFTKAIPHTFCSAWRAKEQFLKLTDLSDNGKLKHSDEWRVCGGGGGNET